MIEDHIDDNGLPYGIGCHDTGILYECKINDPLYEGEVTANDDSIFIESEFETILAKRMRAEFFQILDSATKECPQEELD